jgi:hypothetical protein
MERENPPFFEETARPRISSRRRMEIRILKPLARVEGAGSSGE